jgi:hypothetical protein
MKKTTCIITNETDCRPPEDGVFRFSNKRWSTTPEKLEGFEFGDVIVKCRLDDGLRDWLHMHIGIRVDRIIYT